MVFKIHCFRWGVFIVLTEGYKNFSFGKWGVCMVFKIHCFRHGIKIHHLESGEFKIHCFNRGVSKFFSWKVGSLKFIVLVLDQGK